MAAWIGAVGNWFVRAWLYIAGVFGILKYAVVNKSFKCKKKCWGGHECGQPLVYRIGWIKLGCHWGCAKCDEKVLIKRDSCGHMFEIPCWILELSEGVSREKKTDLLLAEVPCNEVVDLERPCGHVVKGIRCHERQTLKNGRCTVLIDKKRDCGHVVRGLLCWKLQQGVKNCTRSVTWERDCGHVMKDIRCWDKTRIIDSKQGCLVRMNKKLSCGHQMDYECWKEKNVKDSDCKAVVTTLFPCGHLLRRRCLEPEPEKCDMSVMTMKCPHSTKTTCSGEKNYSPPSCSKKCDHIIKKCGHPCSGTCTHQGEHTCNWKCDKKCPKGHPCVVEHDCTSNCPPCSVPVNATHPNCGHAMTCACGDDLGKLQGKFCSEPCNKRNKCGHPCLAVCGGHLPMKCQGITQFVCPAEQCSEQVHGQSLPCGHICKASCASHFINGRFSSCPPCQERTVRKTCKNGHSKLHHCASLVEYCQEPTQVTASYSCGHSNVIRSTCGQPLASGQVDAERREEAVPNPEPQLFPATKCTLTCGVQLEGCGHTCSAKCADCHKTWLHPRCAEKCKDPLPCGHKSVHCKELANKDYCREKCILKCPHSGCFDECGLPCVPCEDPCERGCRHRKCNKKCFEPCDFKLCKERCSEVLGCGHRCFGFCGDKCPPCVTCNRAQILRLNSNLVNEGSVQDKIYVLLPDCGHAIYSTVLDKIMCGELNLDENKKKNKLGLKRCPGANCGAMIWNCDRYWRLLAPILDRYNDYKAGKLVDVEEYQEVYRKFPRMEQPEGIISILGNLKKLIESKLYLPPDETGLPVFKNEVNWLDINSLKLLHCVYAALAKMLSEIDEAENGVTSDAKFRFATPFRPFLSKIQALQWPFHPQELADIKQQIKKFVYSFILFMCIDASALRLIQKGVPNSEPELKYYVSVLMTSNRLTEADDKKLKSMFKASTLLKNSASSKFAVANNIANELAQIMDF